MRTVVFINSHSRQAAQNIKTVREYFSTSDVFEVLDFIVVDQLNSFDQAIAQLRSHKKAECIIVGSGDGTIIGVLNAMKDRKGLVYGFLPLGTSNDFVWSLGLPADFRKALKVMSVGHTRFIPLGSINGKIFANISGIGLPANVVNSVTDKLKKYLGPLAYMVRALSEMVHHDAIWCEITSEGKTTSFYTHHLIVANGKYHGHFSVHEIATLDNDDLAVVAVGVGPSRIEWLRSTLRFILRRPKKRKKILAFRVKEAHIRTRPTREIQADGEMIGRTPATFKIIPEAIRVFTPAEKRQIQASKLRNKMRSRNK